MESTAKDGLESGLWKVLFATPNDIAYSETYAMEITGSGCLVRVGISSPVITFVPWVKIEETITDKVLVCRKMVTTHKF